MGEFKDNQFQGHKHKLTIHGYTSRSASGFSGEGGSDAYADDIEKKSGYGTPRYGTTTHGKQIGVTYLIKVL